MINEHYFANTCVIIEGSAVQSRLISSMLVDNKWDVNSAQTLEGGLKLIAESKPALVFVNMVLPDGVGESNVKKIREAFNECIIVATSATKEVNKDNSSLSKSKNCGADFLLPKPFSNERLASVLNDVDFMRRNKRRLPHILVIDDSRSARTILQNIIASTGYRVTLAESIDDALGTVDIFNVDVIISDMNMPGIPPVEAIPKMRNQFPNVGIIAMSGNVDAALENTLFSGADAIIAKPFEIPKLLEALNIAFSRRHRTAA